VKLTTDRNISPWAFVDEQTGQVSNPWPAPAPEAGCPHLFRPTLE